MTAPSGCNAGFNPKRRRFLQTGLAGSMLLALASLGGGLAACSRGAVESSAVNLAGRKSVFLTARDISILKVTVPALLEGALPQAGAERTRAIEEIMAGVDTAVSYMSAGMRAELRQLFDLMGMSVTRVLTTGIWSSWDKASAADVKKFVAGWQASRFDLFRGAYLGLHDLIAAAWYGNPRSWPRIGYNGPASLGGTS